MNRAIIPLYIVFLIIFIVFSYTFVDANLLYLHILYSGLSTEGRLLTTLIYIFFIIIFFTFYIYFLFSYCKQNMTASMVRKLVICTAGILLLSYPAIGSYDIFNYLTSAKVLYHYHENPYITMPIEFVGEPYLNFTRAANKVALYGPVWLLITGIPYSLGLNNFVITLFSFKLVVVIFYFATLYVLWRLKGLFSVIVFGLNPLVVFETIVSGHNDIVMMFFALVAIILTVRKKRLVGIILFLLSILIKYATLFLLPVFIHLSIKLYRKQKIELDRIFYYCFICMLLVFILSPIREEMYPWYGIWFLLFASLIKLNNLFLGLLCSISFGLLLRYIPYMWSGTYLGSTPFIKIAVTILPVFLTVCFFLLKSKLWKKVSLY